MYEPWIFSHKMYVCVCVYIYTHIYTYIHTPLYPLPPALTVSQGYTVSTACTCHNYYRYSTSAQVVNVQFSRSVVSDSLQPHGLQHTRPPCPSSTHVHRSVMPSNHLILCFPLLLLPSIFPSIRSFPMSQFFASGGQSIGVSASASVLPMNIQDWFPWGWTGWISLQSMGLSRVFPKTTVQKHQFFGFQLSL